MKVVMGLPAAALLFWFTLLGRLGLILNSDFAITFAKILGDLSDGDGYYRLDYRPPVGLPAANTTLRPRDISDKDTINFSGGLPGTKYTFWLFYSNRSVADHLTWSGTINTTPDPPTQLSIDVQSSKVAVVRWDPPNSGSFSGFKLKVIPLSEPSKAIKNIQTLDQKSTLKDLTPGATYEIQLYSEYEQKESTAYISTNFTTKPNTPGRFIVWFRNETTLLVLWQPPYPAGYYTDYKVSIKPEDSIQSELYVHRESEPPGPAQAAFNGLVPGRAYNISVETFSDGQISDPTRAQYRTVPLRPHNVTFDQASIGPDFFSVRWSGPTGISEFDRYQVAIGIRRKTPQIIEKGQPLVARFAENLTPGRTYQVVVKTVSGSVASWPATGNVTTRPLPVSSIREEQEAGPGSPLIVLAWQPNSESQQDSYKIEYNELAGFNGDSSSVTVEEPRFSIDKLQPGRNYSIAIKAVSNGMVSRATLYNLATRPSEPIVEVVKPIKRGLEISWRTDVTSKQEKYIIVYTRNDTKQSVTRETTDKVVKLRDLYPGAEYKIQVLAVSNGLQSTPHVTHTAVPPNPPTNLEILKVEGNTITLAWDPPTASLFTDYLIQYRPTQEDVTTAPRAWTRVSNVPLDANTFVLRDLTPGEDLEILLDTVSLQIPSGSPGRVTQLLAPAQLTGLQPELDAENVTLAWPVPRGRVDSYTITWAPVSQPEEQRTKTISGDVGRGSLDGTARILIESLQPGVNYHFEMFTKSHELFSPLVTKIIRTQPLCTSEIFIIMHEEVTSALTLRYTRTPKERSNFDTYRFMLSDPEVPVKEKAASDQDRKVTFVGLEPGRLYNITLWTVSGGVTSRPLERQDRLHPEPVSNINATKITDREIALTWNLPAGNYDSFEVQYLDAQGHLIQDITFNNEITIGDLRPYRNYTFTVVTKVGTDQSIPKRSTPISAFFSTREGVPGSLTSFETMDVQPSLIKFKWNLPSLEANGVITGFTIVWGPTPRPGKPFIEIDSRDFGPKETEGTISGLVPGEQYTFQIKAKTRVGFGPKETNVIRMPILAPPVPAKDVYPTEIGRSMHTITVRYRQNYFSDEHGKVRGYTIIVAEDYTKETKSNKHLPTWHEAQKHSTWPPYQVMEPYNPFDNSSVDDFTIGTDEDCLKKHGYCNGPLRPGTLYRFKIRAYTGRGKYSETSWSQPISTDPDNTAILVGITVPIVLLVVILLAFVILRKLQCGGCHKSAAHHITRGGPPVDSISLPDSVIETSRPVKLKDFAEHYRIMSADSDFRFSEEYEELKHVGRDQLCTAADLPVNRPKNRFTNILPYDHSRVKLQPTDDEEGSDYINANFVPGYNSKREFIVTQGPLHSTRDDFWRMCWETNSRAIVMLTRCYEKGREKCDQYWPLNTDPVYYGDIQVTILNESHYPDWDINEFRMMRGDTVRTIRHFHFTTWPDFGVPEPPQTLVRFVRAFRERVSPEQRPIVAHCSAGVGRSGTMIAIDRILQGIRKFDVVDIFGIVYEMRKERVWMVQTEQQYICIHQCLLAVLEGKEYDQRHPDEMHDNEAFEDDEGIAESGM